MSQVPSAPPAPRYHVFLLRLWCETEQGPWRISLQTNVGHGRLGFADLASLVDYLDYVMGATTQPQPQSNSARHVTPEKHD